MANKPCMGIATCPQCGREMLVIWNGNHAVKCYKCGVRFNVKRQKLKSVVYLDQPVLHCDKPIPHYDKEEQSKMFDLKPCPFCGSETISIAQTMLEPASLGIMTYKVCCVRCAAQIYRGKREDAIAEWNRRATEDG